MLNKELLSNSTCIERLNSYHKEFIKCFITITDVIERLLSFSELMKKSKEQSSEWQKKSEILHLM